MLSNKLCNDDSQCSNNYMCTFNEKNLNHECKNLNQNNLYLGCLDKDYNNFEYISSNSPNHNDNFNNCLNFSRNQVNKDGFQHNNFMFRKKKESSVDMSSINIYLISGKKNIATLPIQDYFNSECDINSQNCKFIAKNTLFNFINANKNNSSEKLYIEINYECYNETNKNKEVIPVNEINNFFSFEINCPKNKNDPRFESKCISFYLSDKDYNKYNKINKKKLLYTCNNPIYNTPRIVKNINVYKKNIFKNNNNQITNFERKIKKKKDELLKLEAEKYQKIHKINNNEDITYNKALENVNKLNIYNSNDEEKKWKLFKNFDALQNIIDDPQYSDAIKTYNTKIYTVEEAIKVANENNESFFIYYHNSFELDQYSSSLYFIDIYKIDNNLFDKNSWNNSNNVTTGLLNFENYYSGNESKDPNDIQVFKDYITNLLVYNQLMTDELRSLNSKNVDDVNSINETVINNLNNNLDKRISTKNQAIKMNQSEENVNNFLINLLTSIALLLFFIFIFIILYYSSKKPSNINQ